MRIQTNLTTDTNINVLYLHKLWDQPPSKKFEDFAKQKVLFFIHSNPNLTEVLFQRT